MTHNRKTSEPEMTHAAEELANQIFAGHEIDDLTLRACELAYEAQNLPQKSSVHSTTVACILAELNMDKETLIATLMSDATLEPYYTIEQFEVEFGSQISQLVLGIRKLNQFKDLHSKIEPNEVQNERLRQMLLAMTSDIRIMIVKLAYRVARLRALKYESDEVKHQVALETQLIFAPLANRLGMAQLKWELEDLSFRFLHPDTYKSIAKQLDDKRNARETYIQNIMSIFKEMMEKSGIPYQISGRPKHIYSIWKKMTRKQLPIEELYDLRAIRIYVDNVQQCYEVLGFIHSRWNYVKDEFDDYIASPKENGYQSIHTVIFGPENKTVEIQIRTHEMHYTSEYGVAAHWRYKEGGQHIDASLEQSINLVRQMLEYNDDPDLLNQISTELLSEHIYVMTPNNDIITMSQGTTALDFAYQIHSELGHKCRGAKINGKIVPLTTKLATGDRVEVLTIKNGTPSRNWLNPNLGYLGSSRSRAKVRHWFNLQNKEANIEAGESLFHKELRRLHAHEVEILPILERFHQTSEKGLFEALGKGQINERQLANAIQKQIQARLASKEALTKVPAPKAPSAENLSEGSAYVVGASQLKTHLAPCCAPELGDDIVGFVTRGRGVTIHKSTCSNMLHLSHEDLQRIIQVDWYSEEAPSVYTAEIEVLAFDRKGLLRDVMSCLVDLNINLTSSNTLTNKHERTVTMKLEVELEPGVDMSSLLDQIEKIQNVESASIRTIND